MELKTYDEKLHMAVHWDNIVKKDVRKIYYVSSGRNAWWSTWIKRYTSGCMHTTLNSAKLHAEKLRTNGSVFYIHEIPALVFEGSHISFVVTQINCADVLKNYKPISSCVNKKVYCHVVVGTSFRKVYNAFSHNSIFWSVAPPAKDSVIRLLCHKKINEFDEYRSSETKSYRSESIGSKYSLYWNVSPFNIDGNSIVKIKNLGYKPHTQSKGGFVVSGHYKERSGGVGVAADFLKIKSDGANP